MKWTKVEDKVPERGRYIALCTTGGKEFQWKGIIDVFFDPHIGWQRCENEKELVYVLAYISMEEFDQFTRVNE